MSVIKIKLPAPDEYHLAPGLMVSDSGDMITIRIDDIFGDDAVICLEEPQRSEFIRKIKELNHD